MKQCDIGKSKVFVVLLISGNLPGACFRFSNRHYKLYFYRKLNQLGLVRILLPNKGGDERLKVGLVLLLVLVLCWNRFVMEIPLEGLGSIAGGLIFLICDLSFFIACHINLYNTGISTDTLGNSIRTYSPNHPFTIYTRKRPNFCLKAWPIPLQSHTSLPSSSRRHSTLS